MLKKRKPALSLLFWLLALGWAAVLFFFSGQNGAESGDLSRRFTEFLLKLFPGLPFSAAQLEPVLRKMAHFGIFAVEGFLLGMAAMSGARRPLAGAALSAGICAAVAALNEYHQSFSDGRVCALGDVAIDTGGALCGIAFALAVLALAGKIGRRNVIIS